MNKDIEKIFKDYCNSKYTINQHLDFTFDDLEQNLKVGFRYEGTSQDRNLTDSIRMRVYDPLWMLCRQWQLGEFRGNDAGTAMSVKYTYEKWKIEDHDTPIEPLVERTNPDITPLVRVESAMKLFQMLQGLSLRSDSQTLLLNLKAAYPLLQEQVTATQVDDAQVQQLTQQFNGKLEKFYRAYRKRAFDGFSAYLDIVVLRRLEGLNETGREVMRALDEYAHWFQENYLPAGLCLSDLRRYDLRGEYSYAKRNDQLFFDEVLKKFSILNYNDLLCSLSERYPDDLLAETDIFDVFKLLADSDAASVLSAHLMEKKQRLVISSENVRQGVKKVALEKSSEDVMTDQKLSEICRDVNILPGIVLELKVRGKAIETFLQAFRMEKEKTLRKRELTDTEQYVLRNYEQRYASTNQAKAYQYLANLLRKEQLPTDAILQVVKDRYQADHDFDAYRLYVNILTIGLRGALARYDGPLPVDKARRIETKYMHWMEQDIKNHQSKWNAQQLGYNFSMNVNDKRYVAKDYSSGQLSWYNFDIDGQLLQNTKAPEVVSNYVLPTLATYAAAPNKRLWQFENKKVFMGNSTEMQSKGNVAMLQYTTMYGNDWMMFPVDVEIGNYVKVREIVVYDTFGVKTVIRQEDLAGSKDSDSMNFANRWQMFTNAPTTITDHTRSDVGLFFPPSLILKQESEPVEEVQFLRDEMANMVWAVEKTVGDGCGGTMNLEDLTAEITTHIDDRNQQELSKKLTLSYGEDRNNVRMDRNVEEQYKYYLQTHVPFNWIPFTVQHIQCDSTFSMGGRANTFRRAKMPVYLNGFQAVRPLTDFLRNGIFKELEYPLTINEEEIQQVGVKVQKNFQRTRWINGSIYNWLGYETQLKNMQGNSQLLFDALEMSEKEKKEE